MVVTKVTLFSVEKKPHPLSPLQTERGDSQEVGKVSLVGLIAGGSV
jgi:hypothetical protein